MNPIKSVRFASAPGISLFAAAVLLSAPGALPAGVMAAKEMARNLNPPRSARAGHAGREAAGAPASTAPATDARLEQQVWVHATNQRIADLLAGLTRATGVTLVAHLEVADERVCVWAENHPLKDLMRDLRHLHGYYWSRSKSGGQYAYSLWQDAQSRAREEAEVQRLALDEQREFQEDVWKHVKALGASHAEMERLLASA